MKKLFSSTKAYLLLAGAAALMASCEDYEPANEQMTKEAAYNYEFERQFGPVDPNHDWSMATRVTANIDLSDAPEGTYEVKIFSEKNGYLLTKAIVENSAQISFDAIKGESSVRILARKTSALGLSVINGYFPIVDGEVNTAKEGTRASTADDCQTTVGDKIEDLGYYYDNVTTNVYHAESPASENGQTLSSIPNDGTYYYTKLANYNYSDGSNARYKVTYDGQEYEYDLYKMGKLIADNKQKTYYINGRRIYTWSPDWNHDWDNYDDIIEENGQKYRWVEDGYITTPYTQGSPAYFEETTQSTQVNYGGNFYYLNDVYMSIEEDQQVLVSDLVPLVSKSNPDAYFSEGIDNRTLYEDKLKPNIEFVLIDEGPVTFTPVFYASEYDNELGYFYWFETEGMSDEERKAARLAAPRYIFMNHTVSTYVNQTGEANISVYDKNGEKHVPGRMEMPNWVSQDWAQNPDYGLYTGSSYVQGTTYHLAYFGEDYQEETGSYEFPEGVHVAFFFFASNKINWDKGRGSGLFYSIEEMNLESGTNDKHWYGTGGQDPVTGEWIGEDFTRPDRTAVNFSYKGTVVMGIEDNTDYDENDILLFISAPINPPYEITTEEENAWIVACEDLGGTYDYDFNDLVFEVGLHTTITSTISEGNQSASGTPSISTNVYLRPLAAGGTLPAHIYLGEQDLGEIHGLLQSGASTSTPINVGPKGSSVTLSRDSIPVNTGDIVYNDIASVLEDIKIVVTNEGDKDATEITAPNQDKTSNIPQMLLLPKGWDWPTEQTHIYNVYPEFEDWATDMTKNGWIKDPSTNSIDASYYMVNPFK